MGPFLPYYQSRAAWLIRGRSLFVRRGLETLVASLELSSFGVSLTPSLWGLRAGPKKPAIREANRLKVLEAVHWTEKSGQPEQADNPS